MGSELRSFALGLAAIAAVAASACSKVPPRVDAGSDAGPTCLTRVDCMGGEVCRGVDGGSGACGGCAVNGDCKPQELCSSGQLCVFRQGFGDQCTLNADCGVGQLCKQGLCVASAQALLCQRGHCPQGQRCNQANQVCGQDLGCSSDADCLQAQVCNPGTLTCDPRCDPANPTLVCDPTQQCVTNRCVDCVKSADCGPGLTCDPVAGRCSTPGLCYADQSCSAGLVCDLATHTCGAKPLPCTSNDGCARNQVCDVVSGSCGSPQCQPDQFTPNQSQATAAPIQIGQSYLKLTLCGPTDQDWYALSLLSGDQLQVTIDTDVTGSGYSFDVKLIDDAGVILADGPNLALNGVAPRAGTYYLKMTDADPDCLYGFSTLVSHGEPCPPNPFGAIDNQSLAAFIDGGLGPIYLCAGQQDWFAAAVPAGGLSVTLGCDPTQGPLAIALVLADGGVLAAANNGGVAQSVTAPAGTPSPVYLEVTGSGQNNAYTLSLRENASDAGAFDAGAGGGDGGGTLAP